MPIFETRDVALSDAEVVTIRELSVPQLREADRRGTEEMVRLMGMLPEKVVSEQMERQRAQAMERIVRYEGYDPEVLLQHGIIAWSYPDECTEETKLNLGAKKGEIIARAIFELSVLSEGEVGSSSTPSLKELSPPGQSEPTALSRSEDS